MAEDVYAKFIPAGSVKERTQEENIYNKFLPAGYEKTDTTVIPPGLDVIGVVASISALRALGSSSQVGDSILVLAYHSLTLLGGGVFYYHESDTTSADDGGLIIVDLAGRRWKRQVPGETYDITWWGATGNGVTDDRPYIQAAIDATTTGGILTGPRRTYLLGKHPTLDCCLRIRHQIKFRGAGYDFVLAPSAGLGVLSTTDCILIDPAATMTYSSVEDMFIGTKSTGTRVGRNGIRISTIVNGQYIAKAKFSGLYIAESLTNSHAIYHDNDNGSGSAVNITGGLALSVFEDIVAEGGLHFEKTGDSNVINRCTISGSNEAIYIRCVNAGGGPASQFNVFDCNLTSSGSPVKVVDTRLVHIVHNNIEHSLPGASNNAVLDLNIFDGGAVLNNLISIFGTSDATKFVHVTDANKLRIQDNRFGVGLAGLTGIFIDVTSDGVYAGPNIFSSTSVTQLVDNGTNTVNGETPWGYLNVGDTDRTTGVGGPIPASAKVVATTTTLTVDRTWELPLANSMPKGGRILIVDAAGAISRSARLIISRQGTDGINLGTTFPIDYAKAVVEFVTNGVNSWYAELLDNTTLVFGDADVPTVAVGTRVIQTGVAFTAPHTITLPAANSHPIGTPLWIIDMVGALSSTNTLTITRAGGDNINGQTTLVLDTPRARVALFTNSVNTWNSENPSAGVSAKSANYTVTLSDRGALLAVTTGATDKTITLLAAATAGNGFELEVRKEDSGAGFVLIDPSGVETIDNLGAGNPFKLFSFDDTVFLRSNGVKWHTVSRSLRSRIFIYAAGPSHVYEMQTQYADVEVLGAGGGGGGSAATGATATAAGAGGASGSYAKGRIQTPAGLTATLTIGAAGTGGVGVGGNTGGTTTYNDGTRNVGCPGGTGGLSTSTTANAGTSGGGGQAVTGLPSGWIGPGGTAGQAGFCFGATNALGGSGAGSQYGGGGKSSVNNNDNPAAGSGYGAGGGGNAALPSQSARTGAAGSAGVIIIQEYY